LIVELEETKRDLAHKEGNMRQIMQRLQRLEDSQDRHGCERRWEPKRARRYHMSYGSQEEEEEN